MTAIANNLGPGQWRILFYMVDRGARLYLPDDPKAQGALVGGFGPAPRAYRESIDGLLARELVRLCETASRGRYYDLTPYAIHRVDTRRSHKRVRHAYA